LSWFANITNSKSNNLSLLGLMVSSISDHCYFEARSWDCLEITNSIFFSYWRVLGWVERVQILR